jgi:hypothetical protein
MKTKILILLMLALQVCFLIFFAMLAPEMDGSIKVGLEHLKEEAPQQAPTVRTRTDEVRSLKTSGDYFDMAGEISRVIMGATTIVTLVSIAILSLALFLSRNKTKTT